MCVDNEWLSEDSPMVRRKPKQNVSVLFAPEMF